MKGDKSILRQIRKHEALYDSTNKKYSDVVYKNAIWQSIAAELNIPVEIIKIRWTSLRDQYRRVLKKNATKDDPKPYQYEADLKFMIPHYKERRSRLTVHSPTVSQMDVHNMKFNFNYSDDSDGNSSDPHDNSGDPLDPKRRQNESTANLDVQNTMTLLPTSSNDSPLFLNYVVEDKPKDCGKPQSDHPIDTFFHAISASVKQLTPIRQNIAKSKIFNVISELELQQLQDT